MQIEVRWFRESRDLYPTLWWSPRKKAGSKGEMAARGSWECQTRGTRVPDLGKDSRVPHKAGKQRATQLASRRLDIEQSVVAMIDWRKEVVFHFPCTT